MPEATDICIIGSGFGGSIPAYYLAQAGQRVVVLERGQVRPPDTLQVNITARDLLGLTHTFNGNGITILVGSVVGGGSIVYSGVSLRAPSFVFERRQNGQRIWPASIARQTLDPFYERAELGLGVHQLGFDEVALRGGSWALRMNRLGYRVDPIRQATTACLHCGFCNTGCKFSRKNVLTFNYLLGAQRAGADVRAGAEAVLVQPSGGGWLVTYGPPDAGSLTQPQAPPVSQLSQIQARYVVLAGGAVGTAGMLLRSRQYLTSLSSQAGRNLSGNGDLALMALLPPDPSLPGQGVMRQYEGVAMDTVCYEFLASHGFVIITQHELSSATVVNGDPSGKWWGLAKKHEMQHYGDEMVGLAVIGVDGSPGQIYGTPPTGDEVKLVPDFGVSGIDYPLDPETQQLFAEARRIVGDLVARMGGTLMDLTLNASPSYPQSAYTAHPVGTARMSDGPGLGVVDEHGEVFGHPGLFVADGAAVPTALGVNPSLTIAALAERVAAGLVARVGGRLVGPPEANPYVTARPGERTGTSSACPPRPATQVERRRRRRRRRGRRAGGRSAAVRGRLGRPAARRGRPRARRVPRGQRVAGRCGRLARRRGPSRRSRMSPRSSRSRERSLRGRGRRRAPRGGAS